MPPRAVALSNGSARSAVVVVEGRGGVDDIGAVAVVGAVVLVGSLAGSEGVWAAGEDEAGDFEARAVGVAPGAAPGAEPEVVHPAATSRAAPARAMRWAF